MSTSDDRSLKSSIMSSSVSFASDFNLLSPKSNNKSSGTCILISSSSKDKSTSSGALISGPARSTDSLIYLPLSSFSTTRSPARSSPSSPYVSKTLSQKSDEHTSAL